MRHIPSLFNRNSRRYASPNDGSAPDVRRCGFERLEERSLLSATPTASVLAEFSAAEAGARAAFVASATLDDQIVEFSSALDATAATDDVYNIDYEVLESGKVRVLAQSGVIQYGSATYCAVPDSVYLELWDKAIARWEEAITVGVEDEVYPYSVDGATVEIDDMLLYLGFSSDYYASASSLGSALNNGYYRDGGDGVAATGAILFNAKYFVANPSESVKTVFYNTALHEIAHSLGYNVTHFKNLGLVELSTETPYSLDELFAANSEYYYYMGEHGVEQYLATYPYELLAQSTSQDRFLMETYTTSGTFGAHPSALLGTYYLYLNQRDGMTYAISPNFKATITPMTLGVLEDLGYTVDYDVADRIGTPAPQDLEANAIGKTVVLNWEKSVGDLSNSTSGAARYKIERRGADDEAWTVVATDVEGTSYFDTTVESGEEYAYRVSSNYIRSNEGVGVFRASGDDVISWTPSAEKYTIYALVNSGSNLVSWSRVVTSTSNTTWTVPSTYGVTLFNVVAVGTTLTETASTPPTTVAVSDDADEYVPEGYSVEDWNAIKRFLAIVDEQGVTNGYKLAGANYSPDLLQNVAGLTWKEVDGVVRLTRIENWSNKGFVGDLDLSGVSQLSRVVVSNNALSSVELDSNTLTILSVSNNDLGSLDVSKLAALESLSCSDAALTTLDVSKNQNLIYLDCGDNPISELDLSENGNLATFKCDGTLLTSLRVDALEALRSLNPWNAALTEVYLPSGFTGTVDLSDSVANGYEWVRSGETIGEEPTLTFDGDDKTVVTTLHIGDDEQTIYFFVGDSELPTSRPEIQYVLQSLSSDAGDSHAAALETRRTWLDEWSNFYVDLWAYADGAPVLSVAGVFSYNGDYFTLTDVAPADGYSLVYTIDASSVSVSAEGAGALDSEGWTLVARMKFAPVGDVGVPLPEDGVLAPVDADFSAELESQTLNGAPVVTVAAPNPNLYPFLFDVDENGGLNTNDLGYFLTYVGQNVEDIAYPKYRVLDYDHNGAINTNDLAYFLQYLGESAADGLDSGYRTEPTLDVESVVPVWTEITPQNATAGETLSLTVSATAPTSAVGVVYGLGADAPEEMTIDAVTGAIEWAIPATYFDASAPSTISATVDVPLTATAVLVAGDDSPVLGGVAETTFSITIANPNYVAPSLVFNELEIASAAVETTYSATISATDPTGVAERVVYAVVGASLPEGMTFDGSTGALVWNIPSNYLADNVDSQIYRLSVTATAQVRDENDVWLDVATESKTYEITVYNADDVFDDALLEEETLELLAENLFVEG